MPFQSTVNINQAPAVAGDFATATTERTSVAAGPGALVAGAGGLQVGLFAWADVNFVTAVNNGSGTPTGFVHREQQASIITYLAETSMTILQGQVITLMTSGVYWVKNDGAAAVTIMMKAFANNATGHISFAAAGATVAGATETKWYAVSAGAPGELVKMSHLPL